MLATHTSPGQGSLRISAERAPDGVLAVVVVTNKKTGVSLRYSVDDDVMPKISEWLKLEPAARYDAVMSAEGLFASELAK